jgi:hypothetical protein
MGLRFWRRFPLGPGLRINLSKSGVSASVGGRGAWFTLGPRGSRATVGIPGTGVSYSTQGRRLTGRELLLLAILAVMLLAVLL